MEGAQSSRQIRKYWPEYHDFKSPELWVFGPNYSDKELDFRRDTKKKALNFVLDMSNSSLAKLLPALETIKEVARAAYDDNALTNLEGVPFLIMMAEDGCFFLLLAFTIIGVCSAGTELNFPENHSVFGTGCVREKLELWLNSLFFVGNQIPYAVLDELMKLSFFQKLKTEHEWPQPLELAKSALHKFLMSDHDQLKSEKPIDLIHCLQLIILGTAECCSESHDPAIPIVLQDDQDSGDDSRNDQDIPSATELSELGITFVKLQGEKGSRGIHYKRNLFNAFLYLPVFKVDRYTNLMIECLHKYEIVHHRARGIEPEASSYFKVLSDLIRTPQDVEVLAASHGQGVVQGQILEGLPELLMGNCVDVIVSQHLLRVRREINKYPPRQWWKRIKFILKISAVVSAIITPFYFLLEFENNIHTFYDQVHH